MSSSHGTLKLFRKLHLYIGIFISPALLFFAFTGAMQTLSLHETVRGSEYKPSLFLMTLAQIHKNATWKIQPHKPESASEGDKAKGGKHDGSPDTAKAGDADKNSAPSAAPAPAPAPVLSKRQMHLPLKIFFLLVALGLFTSTLTGIYMAYKYERSKLLVTALLLVGAITPMLLLPM